MATVPFLADQGVAVADQVGAAEGDEGAWRLAWAHPPLIVTPPSPAPPPLHRCHDSQAWREMIAHERSALGLDRPTGGSSALGGGDAEGAEVIRSLRTIQTVVCAPAFATTSLVGWLWSAGVRLALAYGGAAGLRRVLGFLRVGVGAPPILATRRRRPRIFCGSTR